MRHVLKIDGRKTNRRFRVIPSPKFDAVEGPNVEILSVQKSAMGSSDAESGSPSRLSGAPSLARI